MSSFDCGMLDEYEWDDSYNSVCDSMSWTAVAGISASGTTSEEWDQIDQNGTNVWKFFTHFRPRPENTVVDSCDPFGSSGAYYGSPSSFEFYMAIGTYEDPGQLYFTDWEPQDGEGDSNNSELGLALDVLGGTGNIYTALGSALVDYSTESSGASVVDENLNTEITFDIPVSGNHDDLPHEGSDTDVAETSIRVKNEYASGGHWIEFYPSYTFSFYDMHTSLCGCDTTCIYVNEKTTAPTYELNGYYEVS